MESNINIALRLLESAMGNISQHVYDEYIEKNAQAAVSVGLKSVIIRRQLFKCCDYCARLSGIYDYGAGDYPDGIFSRHENCRCMVTVKTEKGGYQDVWSKIEYKSQKEARQAREKEIETYRSGLDDISKEYLKKANPFTGTTGFQDGYKKGPDHDHKIENSRWIHDNLGGDILFLAEDDVNKMPDFLWNSQYWELKNPTTEKAANSAVRQALQQLQAKGNEGGIILDYADNSFNLEQLIKIIDTRMRFSKQNNVKIDVLIKSKKRLVRMLRY